MEADLEAVSGIAWERRLRRPERGMQQSVRNQSSRGEYVLGGNARTASKSVEGDAFAKKQFTDRATDGGAVSDWGDGGAFADVPFDAVAKRSVRTMRFLLERGQ